jgi:plastocyanin domain-containing protein
MTATLLVNAFGVLLILFIIWWFWLSSTRATDVSRQGLIEIVVDNGVYTPPRIEIPAGQTVTLRFVRQDASPCAEQVIFQDLPVSATLPVGKPHDIRLSVDEPGEYEFTCQMGMYRGKLVVK